EPYRPLLEGLRSLARGPLGAELVAILRRHAPLWLTKLPALVAPAAREALARESLGATPARMTREFQDAVEALASIRPLVFALEDLHWADRATLDVLSAIAVGRRDSRLLVLGTYGPDELDSHPSSFGNVLHDLLARDLVEELALSRRDAVANDEGQRGEAGSELARAAARLTRTPFVGRSDELARLVRRLQAARLGTGGLVFLTGEPGIGKTRLLEEFAVRARASGARGLWGRCDEGELARPFGPFAEVLAAHADESDEASLREDLNGFAAVATKISPELRVRLPDLPEPAPLSPEEERRRLLDALVQILWSIARR